MIEIKKVINGKSLKLTLTIFEFSFRTDDTDEEQQEDAIFITCED